MVDRFAGAACVRAADEGNGRSVFGAGRNLRVAASQRRRRASPGRRVLGAAREAAPYAVVTLAYALLRKHALLHATGQFDPNHGMMDMARTLPLVMSIYLRQLLVPVGITGSITRHM